MQDVGADQYERQLLTEVIPPEEISVKFDDIGALETVKNTLHEVGALVFGAASGCGSIFWGLQYGCCTGWGLNLHVVEGCEVAQERSVTFGALAEGLSSVFVGRDGHWWDAFWVKRARTA